MSLLNALLVVLAGVGAGTINAVVGSGTLITFPTLVILGLSPVTANVSNNLGLVPGAATAAYGYRSEITGAGRFLRSHVPVSALGGIVGATLLLVLPAAAFHAVVPVLIALGIVLVLAGPRLNALARAHHHDQDAPWRHVATLVGVFFAGIYGGYFGAAQGVILIGLLSALSAMPLQRVNGLKNVLATTNNLVAAVVFLLSASEHIDWLVVALIAVGSTIGGYLGSTVGKRLSPGVLRAVVAIVGTIALGRLLLG